MDLRFVVSATGLETCFGEIAIDGDLRYQACEGAEGSQRPGGPAGQWQAAEDQLLRSQLRLHLSALPLWQRGALFWSTKTL